MTEAEWMGCGNPGQLLAHLQRLPGDRRLLLYAVACCRAHWDLLTHPASRAAVAWAERFADGAVQRDAEYERAEYASEGAAFGADAAGRSERLAEWAADAEDERCTSLRRLSGRIREREAPSRVSAAYFANALMTLDTRDPFDPTLHSHRSLLLAPPLRDIFGNPFRPVAFPPSRRTDTAFAFARQMYDARDFSAMPILRGYRAHWYEATIRSGAHPNGPVARRRAERVRPILQPRLGRSCPAVGWSHTTWGAFDGR